MWEVRSAGLHAAWKFVYALVQKSQSHLTGGLTEQNSIKGFSFISTQDIYVSTMGIIEQSFIQTLLTVPENTTGNLHGGIKKSTGLHREGQEVWDYSSLGSNPFCRLSNKSSREIHLMAAGHLPLESPVSWIHVISTFLLPRRGQDTGSTGMAFAFASWPQKTHPSSRKGGGVATPAGNGMISLWVVVLSRKAQALTQEHTEWKFEGGIRWEQDQGNGVWQIFCKWTLSEVFYIKVQWLSPFPSQEGNVKFYFYTIGTCWESIYKACRSVYPSFPPYIPFILILFFYSFLAFARFILLFS